MDGESLSRLETTSLMKRNDSDKGLSIFTAAMFLAGGMAGSGILALPYALSGTGEFNSLKGVSLCHPKMSVCANLRIRNEVP